MKRISLIVAVVTGCLQIHAQDQPPAPVVPSAPVGPASGQPQAPATLSTGKRKAIIYNPPKTPKGVRLDGDGGSRGPGRNMPAIAVLAPKHVGLTTQEQPTLYWFQGGASKSDFEFALVNMESRVTVLRLRGPSARAAGIKGVSLKDQRAKLDPNVTYHWSVALITDPQSRSLDVFARGVIQRVIASGELESELCEATDDQHPEIYARHGLWYDAMETLSRQVAEHPEDRAIREQRSSLIASVDLPAVAIVASNAAKPIKTH